jgi:hypothetical protein
MYVAGAHVTESEYLSDRFRSDPKLVWEEGLTEMELADERRSHRGRGEDSLQAYIK